MVAPGVQTKLFEFFNFFLGQIPVFVFFISVCFVCFVCFYLLACVCMHARTKPLATVSPCVVVGLTDNPQSGSPEAVAQQGLIPQRIEHGIVQRAQWG